MEQLLQAQNGQSNYDVCFESYGTLDLFVNLLSENSINSSQIKSNYLFNTLQKGINSNNIGIVYATKS